MIKKIINFIKKEKEILSLIIGSKLCVFLIIFLAYNLLPFGKEYYFGNFVYPEKEQITLKSAYKTWDAQHYLFLADKGYKKGYYSDVFYPLYPTIVSFFNYFINNSFISALLVSNIASVLALYIFYLFVKKNHGDKIAYTSLMLFLAFPTAFYLSIIYTEGLFMFLIITFFYFLFKKKYFLAGIFAFFAPIARHVGIFITVPYIFYYLTDKHRSHVSFSLPTFNPEPLKFKVDFRFLLLVLPILGLLFYLIFMQVKTGSPWRAFEIRDYVNQGREYGILNIITLENFFKSLTASLTPLHSVTASVLDRVFFIFFLLLAPLIYKKTHPALFIYSLLIGMTPLFGSFIAYTRVLMTAFPIYITLGILLENKNCSFLKLPYFILSLSLQVIFITLYALNYWVS